MAEPESGTARGGAEASRVASQESVTRGGAARRWLWLGVGVGLAVAVLAAGVWHIATLPHPPVKTGGATGAIVEIALPTANSRPVGIAAGPDRAMWFTEYDGNKIGRIGANGFVTEFALPAKDAQPYCIAAGPDGNLWFTDAEQVRLGA